MGTEKTEEYKDRLFAAVESKEMEIPALYIVGTVVMMYYKLPV